MEEEVREEVEEEVRGQVEEKAREEVEEEAREEVEEVSHHDNRVIDILRLLQSVDQGQVHTLVHNQLYPHVHVTHVAEQSEPERLRYTALHCDIATVAGMELDLEQ